MNGKEVWYFAYGSNLNVGQMMIRVGEWSDSRKAKLHGYKLVFNSNSERWGGFTANVAKGQATDQVYGAVYSILEEKLDVLSRYEGISPADVEVEVDEQTLTAKAYIFSRSDKSQKPPDAYLNLMLLGLRQHGHSDEVIETIQRIAAQT